MRNSMIVAMVLVGQLRSAGADGWHVDAELRPDLAIHPLRLGAGVQVGTLDVTAIVDPLGAIDGQQDLDVVVGIGRRWRVTVGVRATAIGLMSGQAWHDRVLVGAMAPLTHGRRGFQAHVGFEASVVAAEHGAVGMTWWPRTLESYDLGMYVRFSYGR
jgi:hypothetical protein